MSTQDNEKSSLLAPVIGAYEPTDADADRIFAKIEATLDAAPPSRAPAPASTALWSRAGLVAGLSCVALAVATGVVLQTERGDSSPRGVARADGVAALADETPPSAPSVVAPVAEPNTLARVETNADAPLPSVSVDTLPNLAAAPATAETSRKPAASAPSSLRAPAPAADTLEKEARLLADARRASQSGAGDRALALLDEHARTFPNGWLASERDAERILVLCRLGRRAEATRAAAAFLDGRPKGPLTRRVELSCAGASDSKVTE